MAVWILVSHDVSDALLLALCILGTHPRTSSTLLYRSSAVKKQILRKYVTHSIRGRLVPELSLEHPDGPLMSEASRRTKSNAKSMRDAEVEIAIHHSKIHHDGNVSSQMITDEKVPASRLTI